MLSADPTASVFLRDVLNLDEDQRRATRRMLVVLATAVVIITAIWEAASPAPPSLSGILGKGWTAITLAVAALVIWHLHLPLRQWYHTIRVAGLPTWSRTRLLLLCKAQRKTFERAALRRLGPLAFELDEDERQEFLGEINRFRFVLPFVWAATNILVAAAGVVALAKSVPGGPPWLAFVGGSVIAASLMGALFLTLPPSVLYLAASEDQRLETAAQIGIMSYPLFTMLFLHTHLLFNDRHSPRTVMHAAMLASAFRMHDDAEWKAIVQQWIRAVPVVIVDFRTLTPAVMEEFTWTMERPRRGVAGILLNADQLPTMTNLLERYAGWGVAILVEDDLPEFLSRALRKPVRVDYGDGPVLLEAWRDGKGAVRQR